MNKKPFFLTLDRALLFAFLYASAGSALATATFGTRVDTHCAAQPVQASAPQQSRPYRASNFSCFLCHTGSPTSNNLNTFGNASLTCTSATCGATVNPFCVATPPGNATITAPAPGTTVAQGQSLTFTAGTPTNPDGFPLSFTWLFTGGMPNASGQNVSVPMTVAGSITSTLQVRNSVGMLATGTTPTRIVTVNPAANQAPTATINAPAANVTITLGLTVNFQGSGTDPDNNLPLTYSWNFGGGAPNSTAQNPGAVAFNTAGTFTVTFTVTDSLGLASAPVTRIVTVTPAANQAPTATINAPAANVTITQGQTVNFQGSGTDPDNNLPLTYSWNFGGGAPNSTAQNPGAVAFNTAGTFTVTFTVTDSLGLASAPVTRIVTVAPAANQAPTATINAPAANVTITQGQTVNFQGSGTDPDNNLPLTYSWNFGGGAPNSTAQNPSAVMFNTAGTFTVTFTVTDSLGLASAPVTRTITVTAVGGDLPVAIIEEPKQDRAIARGRSVEFHAKADATDDEDDELGFNWSFPGGTPASSTRKEVKVSFNTAGTFTATLTVTDSRGRVSTPASRVITVTGPANMAPTAAISAPAGNVTVPQGQTVNFQGSGTDPDNNLPLSYSWDFGGGAPNSTQQNPGAVTFNTPGTFTVTFTVTDSLGLASEPATRTVTVTPSGIPVAAIVAPAMNVSVFPGGKVTFSGEAGGSANLPLRFRWTFQGGSPERSSLQNPGAVSFRSAGTHTVTMTVTDSKGVVSMPVTRVITVASPNQAPRLKEDCVDGRQDDDRDRKHDRDRDDD